MALSKLLLCLFLYCLQIPTDARGINFKSDNVQDDFKEAIENLTKNVDDEVKKAMETLERIEKDVNIVAYIDLYGLSQVVDKDDKETLDQLDEIENENNKICIDKARAHLGEIRIALNTDTEHKRKELEEEDKIVAAKSKDIVREYLKVPGGFVVEFNACSDDECRSTVTESVLHQILKVEDDVKETLEDAAQPLYKLIIDFENSLPGFVYNYRNQSIEIVERAKKCNQ